MRLIGPLIGVPLALVLVVFAVANRHPIRLELWPLPFSLDLPAFLAVLAPLAAGIVLGALAAWASGAGGRRRAREQRRRAQSLERQLDAARREAPAAPGETAPTP